MKIQLGRLAAVFAFVLVFVFGAVGRAEEELKGTAAVVVALEWNKGATPRAVEVVLARKEYGLWVVAKKVVGEKSVKFEELAVGEYHVGTAEAEVEGKKVFGQGVFEVKAGEKNKVTKIDVAESEVVEIEVDATVDGKPMGRGSVLFSRVEGVGSFAEYFHKPVKIKLAADAKYMLTFDFNSSRLGTKSLEILPREWAGKKILFETVTPAPALALKWTVAEKDRELAGKGKLMVTYVLWREKKGGEWQRPYTRYVPTLREYEIMGENGAALEARVDKMHTFEWGDGKYKLELIASTGEGYPKATLASSEMIDVEIKDGKISGVKEFELSSKRIAQVAVKVEGPDGKPVPAARLYLNLPDGILRGQGKTGADGVWKMEGSYSPGEIEFVCIVDGEKWSQLRKRVKIVPGANEFVISYKEIVAVEGEVEVTEELKRPGIAWRHGGMNFSSPQFIDLDRNTRAFKFYAWPDEFPMLVIAMDDKGMTGVVLEGPPKEKLKLKIPEKPHVEATVEMEVEGSLQKDVIIDRVYFFVAGTMEPAAMGSAIKVPAGKYDSVAVVRVNNGIKYIKMKDWEIKGGERLVIRIGAEEMKRAAEKVWEAK